MSGTVSISLTQQFDNVTGELLIDGRLYCYQAGTTTPQNAYTTAGLTTAFANPLTLESDGRVPQLWFADGVIRLRLTNDVGVVQFDQDNILVMSAGTGTTGVDTTDPNSIAATGDMKWRPSTATISGWVRANGRTIGSSTSGASERGNADCEALFLHLWGSFSDTICPVVTGRGANAPADWAANKEITLIDMRGRTAAGVDDMGGAAAGRITAATIATPTTGGASGGVETHVLTEAQLAAHTHGTGTLATGSIGAHRHLNVFNASSGVALSASNSMVQSVSAADFSYSLQGNSGEPTISRSSSDGDHTHIVSGSTASVGSGTAHTNLPPAVLGCWFMRL
jgi:hypothetical protein